MGSSLRELDPLIRPAAEALFEAARAAGLNPRVTSTRRSAATQRRLYEAWRAGRSRFPAAPPGSSKHETGFAFDMVLSDERYYRVLGEWWESIGGTWGGRFKDPIHFDYRGKT